MRYSTKQFDAAIKNKGMNYTNNNCQGGEMNPLLVLTLPLLYLEYLGWLQVDCNWSIAKAAQAKVLPNSDAVSSIQRGSVCVRVWSHPAILYSHHWKKANRDHIVLLLALAFCLSYDFTLWNMLNALRTHLSQGWTDIRLVTNSVLVLEWFWFDFCQSPRINGSSHKNVPEMVPFTITCLIHRRDHSSRGTGRGVGSSATPDRTGAPQ